MFTPQSKASQNEAMLVQFANITGLEEQEVAWLRARHRIRIAKGFTQGCGFYLFSLMCFEPWVKVYDPAWLRLFMVMATVAIAGVILVERRSQDEATSIRKWANSLDAGQASDGILLWEKASQECLGQPEKWSRIAPMGQALYAQYNHLHPEQHTPDRIVRIGGLYFPDVSRF